MNISFYKAHHQGGVWVQISSYTPSAELAKTGIKYSDLPILNLSRDGTKCSYRLDQVSKHKCVPVFTTEREADKYITRLVLVVWGWLKDHGYKVTVSGDDKWHKVVVQDV